MSINQTEAAYEHKRLEMVIREIERQLEDKQDVVEKFRQDIRTAHRSMWEEGGHKISDLDEAVEAKQYLDDLGREKMKRNIMEKYVKKLMKLLVSPYFGRMDFLEYGAKVADRIYIGIASLAEERTGEYLIYDWRAPVSSMFYDSETGRAEYDCPAGVIKGELLLKRQYRISNGRIDYMFDSSVKIDDEVLQEILSRSVDDKMRTIVTSIQREQNRVIRDDTHKLLVVQGPAGSGKTSIALHRVAYLLYKHRESITASNIVVFSPNQIFNDYISDVLPELGEENMYRTTFREYVGKSLGSAFVIEDMNDQMEYLLSHRGQPGYEARVEGIAYKVSHDFARVIANYAGYLEAEGITFSDVYYKDNLIITGEELSQLFHKDYSFLPVVRRLEKIKHRVFFLLQPFEKERTKQVEEELANSGEYIDAAEIKVRSMLLVREEFQPAKSLVEKMTSLDAYELYCRLFENGELLRRIAGRIPLPEHFEEICLQTVERLGLRDVPYEDAAPIAYLKGLLGDMPSLSGIKHVIIDESQDYSPLQYEILKQLFPHCSLTLLGDLNQSINPFMSINRYENIAEIFGTESMEMIRLSKSYRSTGQIIDFSNALLALPAGAEHIQREGDKPNITFATEEGSLPELIAADIIGLKDRGARSVAVICRTARESLAAYERLKSRTAVKLVTKDDEEFSRGVVVIPSYLAKGLEFDAVIVYNAGSVNYNHENERKLLYTICTRALHHLHIYYSGSVSPFIAGIDKALYE